MIAFFHRNSMKQEDQFDLAVPLKRKNMYLKSYGATVMDLAVKDTQYKAIEPLYRQPFYVIFSPEENVSDLRKIIKKFPQIHLMAGILNGRLLSANEFLLYGQMDITMARASLVQILQNAAGNNLNQQITHHQSTLVSRLRQIGTSEVPSNENDKSVPV